MCVWGGGATGVPATVTASGWLIRAGRVTGTERNPLQRLALLSTRVLVPFMRTGENSAMYEQGVSLV